MTLMLPLGWGLGRPALWAASYGGKQQSQLRQKPGMRVDCPGMEKEFACQECAGLMASLPSAFTGPGLGQGPEAAGLAAGILENERQIKRNPA